MISRLGMNSFRRLRDDEGGISIIEVVVSAMLLVIGAIALFQIVDAAARTSYRAEQSQVSSNLLQRELERVKGAERDDIGVRIQDSAGCMSADEIPAEFADKLNLAWGSAYEYDGRQLIFTEQENEGFMPCQEVISGDVRATVYRAVTWFDPETPDCVPPPNDQVAYAPGLCGMKRIVIGVKPHTTPIGGERAYKEIVGDVITLSIGESVIAEDEEEDE